METKSRGITIDGALVGPIWWPTGAPCSKRIHARLDRAEDAWSELARLLNDGDFQSARFTADTVLEFTRSRVSFTPNTANSKQRVYRRVLALVDFPSLWELVDQDSYSYDFGQDDGD